MEKSEITKIWLTDDAIWISTIDNKVTCEKFSDYQRLKFATNEELNNFEVDEFGIHWPELDEDLCFDGFFNKKSVSTLYRFFINHPEMNASAIARRLGISQSLFAQYVSGAKKPSKERIELILSEIKAIGAELQSTTL